MDWAGPSVLPQKRQQQLPKATTATHSLTHSLSHSLTHSAAAAAAAAAAVGS